jgi:hypothetical protein
MIKDNRWPQAGASKATYSPVIRLPANGVPAGKRPPWRPNAFAHKHRRPGFIAFTFDHALAAAGIAVAISSMAFATSMVTQNSRGRRLEPNDDFRLAQLARVRGHLAQEPARPLDIHSIGFTVTESIARPEARYAPAPARAPLNPAKAPPAAHQQSESYVLSFVYNSMALVKSKHGFYAAKPGSWLPAAGRVLSIERRGHNWILVTERTAIAETN